MDETYYGRTGVWTKRLESNLKPREFRASVFFIGGAVTFTLGLWSSLLRRIPDKNDCFTRGRRGGVMIFFEKNKVLDLGVEPNRVLNILEGI